MLPVFAIIGRPNVGKSTLFNRLTRSREALVADLPGVTRDRQYGTGAYQDRPFLVIDTGGIDDTTASKSITQSIEAQIQEAISQASTILFVVDAKDGITATDEDIANRLRQYSDKVVVLANKVDNQHLDAEALEAHQLGFSMVYSISATRGRGIETFLADTLLTTSPTEEILTTSDNQIRLAFVGKPNVGKSTLVNKILGENRVIVSNEPGTTRNRIAIPFEHKKQPYLLIDTAGIRPRRRIKDKIEKFSVIQTLQTIDAADIVLFILDSTATITEQDLRLIGYIINLYKPFILLFNKSDLLDQESKVNVKKAIERKLQFISDVPIAFISALHRTKFESLYKKINNIYEKTNKEISTAELNKALQAAVYNHQPPLVRGKSVKLNYAHLGGHQPLTVIIHGTRIKHLPQSYLTYLYHFFQKYLNLASIPIKIKLQEKA
jgi:GTP-binding protein